MLVPCTEYFQLHSVHRVEAVKVDVLNLQPILRSPGGVCLLDRWTYKPIVSHCHFGKRYSNPHSGQPSLKCRVTAKSRVSFCLASVYTTRPARHENYQLKIARYFGYKIFIFGAQTSISITKDSSGFR